MIDIKVYINVNNFLPERNVFLRYLSHFYGNDYPAYGIEFIFCALTTEQYKRLGNTLHGCIVIHSMVVL